MRAIAVEESNLVDVLRAAVAVPRPGRDRRADRGPGGLLDRRGQTTRVIAIAAAVDDALAGWDAGAGRDRRARSPPPRSRPSTPMIGRDRRPHRSCLAAPREVRRPDDRPRAR